MKVLKSNKFKVSAAVVVLVLGVSIGGTIAWLHKSTDTVRNSFDPGLVNVTIDENNEISIEFHVIIAYGVNISTIAENIISSVKYKVEAYTGMTVKKINIYVEGVRVID